VYNIRTVAQTVLGSFRSNVGSKVQRNFKRVFHYAENRQSPSRFFREVGGHQSIGRTRVSIGLDIL